MPKIGDIVRGHQIGKSYKTRFIWWACVDCGKERWVVFKKEKPTNERCLRCANNTKTKKGDTGSLSIAWKGGRVVGANGYILVLIQLGDYYFPMAMKSGYVAEHRLVIAKHLGRCLLPWETVHHKNGIKDDNRLKNLELMPNPHRHDALTRMGRYMYKMEEEISTLKLENGLLRSKLYG